MSDDGADLLGHPAVRRVVAALRSAGVATQPVTVRESARTAAEAATALGVVPAQIASSLVFDADGAPVLVLASGGHRVDTEKVGALIGARTVRRASPALVREATGFAIGGVAPVGHPQQLPTIVDVALAEHEVVWAAAGHPHAVFATTFAELVRLSGGTPADVAAG